MKICHSDEAELLKNCSDPMWRLHNLYYITDKDGNEVLFKPWPEQLKFLKDIWYRNIIPKARQRGFSTIVQLLMLDAAIFNDNTNCAVIAQDKDTASKIFRTKIRYAWERLPAAIRAMNPLAKNTETEFVWENGSSLYVAVSARGTTLQYLHISELGTVAKRYPEKVHEIITGAFAAVDKNCVIIIESTVESPDDKFSEMVKTAQRIDQELKSGKRPKLHKQEYRLHFASWWDADEYETDPVGVVISSKDQAYFFRLEGILGIKITDRKRAWYVLKRDSDYAGDQNMMFSQYPSTLEEAFQVAAEGRWLAKQMAMVRNNGQILDLPYRPDLPAFTCWDLADGNDDVCLWIGQDLDPWTNWIGFIEACGEPYGWFAQQLQALNYVWAFHLVPHDADNRKQDEWRLKTARDILQSLGLQEVITVPRIPNYQTGVTQLRTAMSTYRFDRQNCAEGIIHLDEYAKVWDQKHGRFTSIYARNGHQHAADALRQHAQWKHNLDDNPDGRGRTRRRNRSAMAA